MSVAAKIQSPAEAVDAGVSGSVFGVANRRVARDFVVLLGVALTIGLTAGVGMMLAVLLLA
jgi:hypothetical protein